MIIVWLKFLFFLPYLLFLKSIDIKNNFGKVHLYGIKGFFGLPGAGKTIAMCKELQEIRKTYGDKIYIMTNFGFDDEDFPFIQWQDLTKNYDKPLVVAWDEIQNEFNSRNFKSFPISLLTQLTQVRKGNGIKLLYTSQRFGFVDKNFRSLSATVCDCHTLLGVFTVVREYDILDYEELQNTVEIDRKRKIHPKLCISFIQNNKLRSCYNSYAMLETAKYKALQGEFMNRDEIASINSEK